MSRLTSCAAFSSKRSAAPSPTRMRRANGRRFPGGYMVTSPHFPATRDDCNSRDSRPQRRQSHSPAAPRNGRSSAKNGSTSVSGTFSAESHLPRSLARNETFTPRSFLAELLATAVEDAVDERRRLVGAVALGDLDGLVDRHLRRHVVDVLELVERQPQKVAIDARHTLEAPVL